MFIRYTIFEVYIPSHVYTSIYIDQYRHLNKLKVEFEHDKLYLGRNAGTSLQPIRLATQLAKRQAAL
jgi:hypothetical protein